jgi:hypothetical protein
VGPAVLIVPSLTADGTPVVRRTLTAGAVRRIDALLASGDPPPGWRPTQPDNTVCVGLTGFRATARRKG